MRDIKESLWHSAEILDKIRDYTVHDLEVQSALLLIQVMRRYPDSVTINDLSVWTKASEGSVQRNVRILSDGSHPRRGKKTHGLLTTERIEWDRRKLSVCLTAKGKHLMGEIGESLVSE